MQEIRNFHNARLSLIQSAIKHVLCHKSVAHGSLAAGHPAMAAAHRVLQDIERGGSGDGVLGDAEVCIELLVKYAWAVLTDNKPRKQQIEDQYLKSPCDPGWLDAVGAYVDYYWLRGGKPRYRAVNSGARLNYPLPPPRSGSELVVGLLGDWGTGEPVAQVVVEQLFQYQQPDVVLHVGDIYYAGTHDETQHNFLRLINGARSLIDRQVPVYNIPGNHDYYSGGEAFYSLLGQLNSPAQEASFFSLVNDAWQLQAMDTGYFDHDLFKVGDDITKLHPEEATWHVQEINKGLAAGRQILLFSHHQLFSGFINIGKAAKGNPQAPNFNPFLADNFSPVLSKVTGWFWGHEHLLELYDAYQGLAAGRCIGYSAFPMLRSDNPYDWKYRKVPALTSVELGTTEEVYDHGYAVLRLGAQAVVEYYSVPGDAVVRQGNPKVYTLLHQEALAAPSASASR